MQDQKTNGGGCGFGLGMLLVLGFFGVVFCTLGSALFDTLHDAWIFFHRPDAFARTIEFIGLYVVAVGLCLGAFLGLIAILRLIPEAWMYRSMGWVPSDDQDDY